jgi:hypothetical protein
MLSGVLFVAPSLLGRYFPRAYGLLPLPRIEVLIIVALLLIPIGLVGFHTLHRHSYGWIGHAGFWLVVVASLVVAFGVVDLLLMWLGWGLLGMVAGLVLYGVAILQARVLPRWCGVAFIVAVPVALVSSIPLSFDSMLRVFGLVWLALGYALWSHRVVAAQQPSRVR